MTCSKTIRFTTSFICLLLKMATSYWLEVTTTISMWSQHWETITNTSWITRRVQSWNRWQVQRREGLRNWIMCVRRLHLLSIQGRRCLQWLLWTVFSFTCEQSDEGNVTFRVLILRVVQFDKYFLYVFIILICDYFNQIHPYISLYIKDIQNTKHI